MEQLIPPLRETDFDELFNHLTQHENNYSRFLRKMEIKRKCSPCRRVIDMRNELGELCLVHESEGITLFMPAEAVELFQSQCYLYIGTPTPRVYEALQAWYKHHQGRGERLALPANPFRLFDVSAIPFASHYGRREERREGKFWLRLVKSGEHPAFDGFLREFIEHSRSRYRVSVDYLLSAAIIKGYEQFYLPRMTGMPQFFGKGSAPALEIALRTENNQHLLEYWRDAKNRDMLAGLFPPARIQSLLPGELRETLICSFTHSVRSHLHFFSATREELLQSGPTPLFFQVGARRSRWRVYKFSLEACALHEA